MSNVYEFKQKQIVRKLLYSILGHPCTPPLLATKKKKRKTVVVIKLEITLSKDVPSLFDHSIHSLESLV